MTKKKRIAKYKEDFGEFLGSKRVERGWTQDCLADKLGNNRQNISAMERGKLNPTLVKLKDISDAYGLTVGELLKEFDDWQRQ